MFRVKNMRTPLFSLSGAVFLDWAKLQLELDEQVKYDTRTQARTFFYPASSLLFFPTPHPTPAGGRPAGASLYLSLSTTLCSQLWADKRDMRGLWEAWVVQPPPLETS